MIISKRRYDQLKEDLRLAQEARGKLHARCESLEADLASFMQSRDDARAQARLDVEVALVDELWRTQNDLALARVELKRVYDELADYQSALTTIDNAANGYRRVAARFVERNNQRPHGVADPRTVDGEMDFTLKKPLTPEETASLASGYAEPPSPFTSPVPHATLADAIRRDLPH